MIVRGPTGSGKTMLAGQYARAGAVRGEKVVYYGFEEPKGILLRNFASIGMPMDELEKAGNLHIICRYPEAMGLEDLLVTLRMGLEEIEPSLVVMDSISSIEHSSSEKGFRQFMIGLASLLREHARGALLTQTVIGQRGGHAHRPLPLHHRRRHPGPRLLRGHGRPRAHPARPEDARLQPRDLPLSAGDRPGRAAGGASRPSGRRPSDDAPDPRHATAPSRLLPACRSGRCRACASSSSRISAMRARS